MRDKTIGVVLLIIGVSLIIGADVARVNALAKAPKPTPLTITIDDVAELTLPICDARTSGDMAVYWRGGNPVATILTCDGKKWNIEGVAGGGETLEKPKAAPKKTPAVIL